jgi:hypothetical protein
MCEEIMPDTQNLYNVNDGVYGRDGGPYLDQVEGRQQEERRAALEGREPDYDAHSVSPYVPLVTGDQLIANYNPTTLAGDDQKKFDGEITAPVIATVEVPTEDELEGDDDENAESDAPVENDEPATDDEPVTEDAPADDNPEVNLDV